MPATVERRARPLVVGHLVGRRRTLRRFDLVTVGRLGIVAGTSLAAVLAAAVYGRPYNFFDLRIYHGAVVWWTGGGELYSFIAPQTTLGFTYPPFAALAMLPMALVSPEAAGWLNVVATLGVLALIILALVGPIANRYGWPRWFAVALAVPLAAATEPLRETLGFGQVNLLLAGLVILDLVLLRRRARVAATSAARVLVGGQAPANGSAGHAPAEDSAGRAPAHELAPLAWLRRGWAVGAFAGVGVGLATAIKLTPALFILYFVVSRQWRAALTALSTALGATVVTFVVANRESATYFGQVVWETNRIGAVDATPNQSLAGVLARLYDSPVTPGLMWLAFAGLLLAVGLSRAANAHADGDELTAFTLVGLTANAICPISWSHHLVFVVPAIIILFDAALRRRRAARSLGFGRFPALAGLRYGLSAIGLYVLFVVSPIWPYEHKLAENVSHYADGLLGALAENSLALALIVLIALLPWRTGAEPAFYAEPALRRRY